MKLDGYEQFMMLEDTQYKKAAMRKLKHDNKLDALQGLNGVY